MEKLQNLKFTGMGNAAGGNYNEVSVTGIATFSDEITAQIMKVSGICTANASLTAEKLTVSGIFNANACVRGGELEIGGNFTAEDKLEGDSISGTGLLTATASVSADRIDFSGVLSAKEVFGDVVTIKPRLFSRHSSRSKVDHIECTELVAAWCDFGEIWAQNVTLSGNCTVEKLYCDGEINLSEDCKVGKVYRMGEEAELPSPTVIPSTEEEATPSEESLCRIEGATEKTDAGMKSNSWEEINDGSASMDATRNGFDCSQDGTDPSRQDCSDGDDLTFIGTTVSSLPWEDDGKIRLVAFIGHKLVQEGERGCRDLSFTYEGDARDVICTGSLGCGDVSGNVSAGDSVRCGDVNGDVSAGDSVECSDVSGNVSAGDGVECSDVSGNVSAGDGVECGDVSGNVSAGDSVECGDVGGSVRACGSVDCGDIHGDVTTDGGDVDCGDVGGSIRACGSVDCGDVHGDVTADGDVECGDVGGSVHAGGDLHCTQ